MPSAHLRFALGALDWVTGTVVDVDRVELLLDLARVEYLAGRIPDSVRTSQFAADEGERTGRADVVGAYAELAAMRALADRTRLPLMR